MRALTCILTLSLACLASAAPADRPGRTSVEGFLDRHVGAEPEPQQRRDRDPELGRQGHHRHDQSGHRQHRDQERDAQSRRLDRAPRGDAKDKAGQAITYVIDGKIENLPLRNRTITGTWKNQSENGIFKISRQ